MKINPKVYQTTTTDIFSEIKLFRKSFIFFLFTILAYTPNNSFAQDHKALKPIPIPSRPEENTAVQSDKSYSFSEITSLESPVESNPEALVVDEKCGTVMVSEMNRQKYGIPSNEDFELWMEREKGKIRQTISSRAIVTIPVVVHVIHNGQTIGGLPNISDAQIQSQIDVLNEDFRRMNADASNTPADFIGVAADVEIEFCLATVDPNGVVSSGITRYNGGKPSYSISDLENIIKPNTIWHPDYYFNIWVVPLQGGLLGYAQFPDMSLLPGLNSVGGAAVTDGIVVRDLAFGRGGTAQFPFDLGRIATHEAGHFFGLRHIGGDGNCDADDFCMDTPSQNGQNGFYLPDCTYPKDNDCDDGPGDLPDQFMNYMDYTDDACVNLFTRDQKARMDVVLVNSPRRASLVNSLVCAGTPPPVVFNPYPNAPVNDLCINAETIDCGDIKSGSTVNASPFDIPSVCGTDPGGAGVWYRFVGTGQEVVFSLCNSDYNTKINVYSGDCNALSCLVGSDNNCGFQSIVSFPSSIGTEYFIYISGFNGETGSYELIATCINAMGRSSNIYSSIRPQQNQVYTDDSKDLIAFIHRQDITLHGGSADDSGILRYDLSTDGGESFINNIGVLNSIYTDPARYPQMTGLNLIMSDNPFDENFVWHAPTVSGPEWAGHVAGVSDISTSATTSTENYYCYAESTYLPGGLCRGLPGEFWTADMSENPSGLGDSIYVLKGMYNNGTQNVDWIKHKVIYPNHFTGFNGSNFIIPPNISFSPDGNTGWAAFLGDLVGGQDTTFNPVFIPSFDGGATWGDPIEVDLSTVNLLSNTICGSVTIPELLQEVNEFSTGKTTCAFDFDITVDMNGNPHMFVVVGSASTTFNPVSGYSIYSGFPMVALDIFSEDGGSTWNAIQVSPINNLRSTIGVVNSLLMDNFPQISRTADGSHIFYSWMDKIINTNNPSIAPNLRIAGQRIADGFVTCPKWITLGTIYDGLSFFPTMAPEVLIDESGSSYNLPIVTSQMNTTNDPQTPVRFLYMGKEATIDESEFLFNYASVDLISCGYIDTDEFGYTPIDCNNCNAPEFDWLDITVKTGAVQATGLGDDNSVGPIDIGFDFTYYWSEYSQLKIGSNGWIGFDDNANISSCFPLIPGQGDNINNFLAPFLTDLNLSGAGNSGEVWYWSNQTDSFIISYLNVPYWSANAPGYSGSNTFQVILDAQNNDITFQYLDIDPFTDNGGCDTDLQIGIENNTGSIGLLVLQEALPDEQCLIKFSYPNVVTYQAFDAATLWNLNDENLVKILDLGDIQSLASEIGNVGNQDLTDISTHAELYNNSTVTSLYTSSGLIPALIAGDSEFHTFIPPHSFGQTGNYSFISRLENEDDFNPGNDVNITEIVAVNCADEVVKLDYNTSDALDNGFGWNGEDRDLYGGAVFFNPPGNSFKLDSVELIVAQSSPSDDQTITVKIFANDGPLGMGTLLFETDLLKNEYPSLQPFTVPVGGLDIDENGFFVYWGGDLNTFLLGSNNGPFSRAGYEILNGVWSEYRSNNSTELHVRAYGNCQTEPIITFTKSDEFIDDNGNGQVDIGETIRYTVIASNAAGGGNAGQVMFYSPVDENTKLKVGSVITSQGSIISGNTSGDTDVKIDLGTLIKGTSVSITFDVELTFEGEGYVIYCQGVLSGSNFEDILSDDPDIGGEMDPTSTTIPTLSQWGKLCLFLIMLIMGLLVMKDRSVVLES